MSSATSPPISIQDRRLNEAFEYFLHPDVAREYLEIKLDNTVIIKKDFVFLYLEHVYKQSALSYKI